jgi:hypothetical protein
MRENVGQFFPHLRINNLTTNFGYSIVENSGLNIVLSSWIVNIATLVRHFGAFGQNCLAFAHHNLFGLHRIILDARSIAVIVDSILVT